MSQVQAITPRLREILAMRQRGLKVWQISQITGLKPESVSAAITKAKAALRNQQQ